jgi:hypothetical protein
MLRGVRTAISRDLATAGRLVEWRKMLAWANDNLIRYLRVPACGERRVRGLVLRLLSDHGPSVHCVPRVRAFGAHGRVAEKPDSRA